MRARDVQHAVNLPLGNQRNAQRGEHVVAVAQDVEFFRIGLAAEPDRHARLRHLAGDPLADGEADLGEQLFLDPLRHADLQEVVGGIEEHERAAVGVRGADRGVEDEREEVLLSDGEVLRADDLVKAAQHALPGRGLGGLPVVARLRRPDEAGRERVHLLDGPGAQGLQEPARQVARAGPHRVDDHVGRLLARDAARIGVDEGVESPEQGRGVLPEMRAYPERRILGIGVEDGHELDALVSKQAFEQG
jgi:hypothetical protein